MKNKNSHPRKPARFRALKAPFIVGLLRGPQRFKGLSFLPSLVYRADYRASYWVKILNVMNRTMHRISGAN